MASPGRTGRLGLCSNPPEHHLPGARCTDQGLPTRLHCKAAPLSPCHLWSKLHSQWTLAGHPTTPQPQHDACEAPQPPRTTRTSSRPFPFLPGAQHWEEAGGGLRDGQRKCRAVSPACPPPALCCPSSCGCPGGLLGGWLSACSATLQTPRLSTHPSPGLPLQSWGQLCS